MPDPSFTLPSNDDAKKKIDEIKAKFDKSIKPVESVKEESEKVKILREYNNMESNIPINHRYWKLERG